MSDIFDEVEEDLRKDRAEELWKKYGNYVIALAILVVAVTAGYKGWQSYTAGQHADMANQFEQAVMAARDENYQEADGLLSQLSKEGNASYATIASLQQAAVKVQAGDLEGAIVVYDALAADSEAKEIYRDLATVFSVMHQLDTGDAQQLLAIIEAQTADNKAWRYTARELGAVLALKAGDTVLAADYLNRISDDAAAPQSVRLRAGELLRVVEG